MVPNLVTHRIQAKIIGCYAQRRSLPISSNSAYSSAPSGYLSTSVGLLTLLAGMIWTHPSMAQPPANASLPAGHSFHGEVFDEGPRQAAQLLGGTGPVQFETSSSHPQVRKFVEQGIGQLHGFWYFEAERSFRQAAAYDPHCAIAYWGMAAANLENTPRAKELIQKGFERIDKASQREQRYIIILREFLESSASQKEREGKLIHDLESLVRDYPDDLEAKAWLGYALYRYRTSVDRSVAEVDVVLDQILAKEPKHPVHHYRIHIWDNDNPQRALDSAGKCGLAAPGVAHMWHMCGHIFSRVKRYGDAAWFQEASARVDHRHMMHNLILPDQIHNFAHNNEWLVRNLVHVGRVDDALDLAKNMIELPRHPKLNTLNDNHSATYGRDRLMEVLERFELWSTTIELAQGPYLQPDGKPIDQIRRWRLLGRAFGRAGEEHAARQVIEQIQHEWEEYRMLPPPNIELEAQDLSPKEGESPEQTQERQDKKRKEKTDQELAERKRITDAMERAVAAIEASIAWQGEKWELALEKLERAEESAMMRAHVLSQLGRHEEAIRLADEYVRDRKHEVAPLAGLIEVLWRSGNRDRTREEFLRLRAESRWIQLDAPVFARLAPIAASLNWPGDWRIVGPDADDLGERPPLNSLGPYRWDPPPAPDWILPDAHGQLHSLRDFRGKTTLIVFYLGAGCLHCAEQLQTLAPRVAEFTKGGIEIVAISSDDRTGLDQSQRNYSGERFPFPLVADPSHEVFRAYRAFDDFEGFPLHGTFLVDPRGRILWHDIGPEPFMDIPFLIDESQRLHHCRGSNERLSALNPMSVDEP